MGSGAAFQESLYIPGQVEAACHQHHGGGEKPRTEPVRAAFNRYVNHLSEAFKGQVAYYEIWNEWDVEDPRDPRFTQDYARLIADAAGIVRQRDPAAKVLAGMPKTEAAIRDLADKLEIAPGIIVGRLQKEGLLRWESVLNKSLKVSYEWRHFE